jgi:hypothetical protein
METTYINLLAKLKADVKSDNIPAEEKAEILRVIHRLEIILWKYSA